jgi:hypothetical protein
MSSKAVAIQRLVGNGSSGSRMIRFASLRGIHISISRIRGTRCIYTAFTISRCSKLWVSTVLRVRILRYMLRTSSEDMFLRRNSNIMHILMPFPSGMSLVVGSESSKIRRRQLYARGKLCGAVLRKSKYWYCKQRVTLNLHEPLTLHHVPRWVP